MPRRTRSKPPLTGLDAGVCFLALEHFRKLGLPCASDAEVLRVLGADTSDPEVVEDVRLRLMLRAQSYLTDGLILNMSLAAADGV
jgi:hypothetical protein